MAISLKHAFTCNIPDGSDEDIVRPSNWNEEHDITMATARLLGRLTAANGVVEELTAAQVIDFLALVIGTNVQAWSANLDAWSLLDPVDFYTSDDVDTLLLAYYTSTEVDTILEDYYTAAEADLAFQPLDSDLTAIAALTTTSFGRGLLALAAAANLATAAGVGTGDSPQFTAVNVGHASDTTVERSAAGQLSVEGNVLAQRDPARTTQTGASYNLLASDAGKIVTMNNGSANTVNIQLQSSEAYVANTIIEVKQLGVGVTTIDAASGVTLNGVDGGSAAISNRYQSVGLFREASNTWIIDGAHEAVA